MYRATTGAVLVAVLLLAASPAGAVDRIFLKNGSVLSGTILKETETEIVIEITDLGKVFVPRIQVDRIEGGAIPPDTPETPENPELPVPSDPVDPPTADPMVVEFNDLKKGETVLVLMKNRDGDHCRHSGLRLVARVKVVGSKRIKLLTAPDAGALGFSWIRRDRVSRVIRLDGHLDRRLILIEGMESGAWIRGKLVDGSEFSGRLDGLSGETGIFVSTMKDGQMDKRNIPLLDIREAESLARARSLTLKLRSVQIGEPVRIEVADRDTPLVGRWAGVDSNSFLVSVFQGPEVEPSQEALLRHLPITSLTTLPDPLRPALQGTKEGDHLTLSTVTLRDGALRRRTVTGRIVLATTKSITIETPEGREDFEVADIRDAVRPAEEEVPGLVARLAVSGSDSVLSVLPGMGREEALRLIGEDHPGIDVVFEEGRVSKVYCAPPLEGPIFGLDLGAEFRKTVGRTDLIFDTRVEPMEGAEPRIATLLSHTLKGKVVKLFLTQGDRILAIEVSNR